MEGLFTDNEKFYSDIKLLLYPDTNNVRCKYVLCAHHLSFIREKNERGYYILVQKAPLSVLCKLGDEKDINTDMCFRTSNFFKKIVTIDGAPLLFVVRNGDFFFEVTCKSLISGSQLSLVANGEVSYYSHKYNLEEMISLFSEAMSRFRLDKLLYIESISRLDKEEDISLLNLQDKRVKTIPPQFWRGPSEEIFYGFPRWSDNLSNELSCCSIYTKERTIYFEISYNDFTPHYNTDRDGGWYVYTHEEKVVGEIHFQAYYSLQEYMMKISSVEGLKFESTGGDNILECKLPFELKGNLYFNGSVKDLFSVLEIKKYKTRCITYEEGSYDTEDSWIYGSVGTGPLWGTKDGKNPYPTD